MVSIWTTRLPGADSWLVIVTAILAYFTWTLWRATNTLAKDAKDTAVEQAQLTRDALNLSRQEFISSHRPRLIVRNVVLTPSRTPQTVDVGELVAGQFFCVNVGDTPATVTSSGCWVVWEKSGRLPMARPYEGLNGNHAVPQTTLKPGESTVGLFQSETAMTSESVEVWWATPDWLLWVMGWIEYRDDNGTPRRTTFCQEFIPFNGRFRAVVDPDYEHAE